MLRTFRGHSSMVKSVCYSATGRYAISGSLDRTILLWEVSTGKPIRSFDGHLDLVTSVAFAADEKYVLSGSIDKTMMLWDIDRPEPVHVFEHNDAVRTVCFHPDGRSVVSRWPTERWPFGLSRPESAHECSDSFVRRE